jgi:DNA-binding NarL/FixJ family response regulator
LNQCYSHPTRVLLLEDDDFTRETLKAALLGCGVDIVHDAQNAKSAVDYSKNNPVDIAVINYNLGREPNGIDVPKVLYQIQPAMSFVLLTGFLNPEIIKSVSLALPEGSSY